MANTFLLKSEVEEYVRGVLATEHGVPFSKRVLRLVAGGTHEFDAVSTDGLIVASIKSSSGLTSGGKNPSGKIKDAEAELYYLTLVDAPSRLLVVTNPEFYLILMRRLVGRLAPGIDVQLIELSPELFDLVAAVRRIASLEVTPTVVSDVSTGDQSLTSSS